MDNPNPERKTQRARRPRNSARSASQDPVGKAEAYDPHVLAPRLQRLVQAMAAIPESPSARLTRVECQAVLEFYVDAETRGEEVRKTLPRVWKHLQSCRRCRLAYQLLTAPATEVPPSELDRPVAAPPLLPFFRPHFAKTRWTTRVRPRVGGAPLNFGLAIQAAYLRQRLESRPDARVRGDAAAPFKTLVFSDTIPLGDRDVVVKIWMEHQPDSARVCIEALLACSVPLPDPLQLKLTWNEYVHSDLVHGKRYTFDKLPASVLQAQNDLQIEFVASDDPDRAAEGHFGGDPG